MKRTLSEAKQTNQLKENLFNLFGKMEDKEAQLGVEEISVASPKKRKAPTSLRTSAQKFMGTNKYDTTPLPLNMDMEQMVTVEEMPRPSQDLLPALPNKSLKSLDESDSDSDATHIPTSESNDSDSNSGNELDSFSFDGNLNCLNDSSSMEQNTAKV